MKITPILLALSASAAVLAATTPALAGHAPDRPTGKDHCAEPDWISKARVPLNVVPGSIQPGEEIRYRLNGRHLNHFEADPEVTFTDAATGEESVIDLPYKATEPGEQQRLVWSFTVASEGTVSYGGHLVVYCAGDSTEHGDGMLSRGSFEVRENHPDLF